MNQRRDLDFLKDIQDSIRLIDNYIEDISKEEFFNVYLPEVTERINVIIEELDNNYINII